MSLYFNHSYLMRESPVITAYPFAMACWFMSRNTTDWQSLMWVGDKDSQSYYCSLELRGDQVGDYLSAMSHWYGGAVVGISKTTSAYTKDVWQHAAGIWLSRSERHCYLNAANKGSNTDSVGVMANHDRTSIGMARDSSPDGYIAGRLCEAAVWDLTNWGANDAERETNFEKAITSMAKGFAASLFPNGLVAYWQLINNYTAIVGDFNMTGYTDAILPPEISTVRTKIIYPHSPLFIR